MELGPQLVDAAVVVLTGLLVAYVVRDRARHQEKVFTAQIEAQQAKTEAQMAVLRTQLGGHDARSAAIQAQINTLGASMDRQFASVRSDLTQVALAVGAQPRPQAG
jgi:hypothetical protein